MNRQPRDKNEAHRKFIGTLSCVICGNNTTTEAAHIRMADRTIAKPLTGMATKSDDRFTVPLCGAHHRSQHEGNEREWWAMRGLDPIKVSLALWSVSGNYERGEEIARACNER